MNSPFSPLEALSPLDGRYASKVTDLRTIFSEQGLMKARLTVEIRWLQTLAEQPALTEVPAFEPAFIAFLDALISDFTLEEAERVKAIESTINHDVKAIEYYLKEKCLAFDPTLNFLEFIHFGATSEDINNLSYGLMLKDARTHALLPTLGNVTDDLYALSQHYSEQPMLSRTHGQPASPTTVGKEIANVHYRLMRAITALGDVSLLGKFNGAVGNYNALLTTYPDLNWPTITGSLINRLGLDFNPYTTQIEPHDYIAEFCQTVSRINTILIDFNRDCWGYISLGYFTQRPKDGEVGSSTMPHKVNPIDFENSEGNLGVANALANFFSQKLPISRWQRDLTDSTTLRNLGILFGYSVLAYQATRKGLSKLSVNRAALDADLDNHWEVLAEPIQMMMRRYGIDKPYEKLKALTRGQAITRELLHDFIDNLAIPAEQKQQLQALTPARYLGLAEPLCEKLPIQEVQ